MDTVISDKQCARKERIRAWHAVNLEHVRAYNREWMRAWRANNSEHVRAYQREWLRAKKAKERKREEKLERMREWHREHLPQIRERNTERQREWIARKKRQAIVIDKLLIAMERFEYARRCEEFMLENRR